MERKSDFFAIQPLSMPNVEVLRIFGGYSQHSQQSKLNLMKATPNVKTLLITEDDFIWSNTNFSTNFRDIFDNLTKLERLGWLIHTATHHEVLYKLDAAVTGLPSILCKKMSKKFLHKTFLSPEELVSYQLHPENSSILNLKGKEARMNKVRIYLKIFFFIFRIETIGC